MRNLYFDKFNIFNGSFVIVGIMCFPAVFCEL